MNKTILLTGGTGRLGRAIVSSGLFPSLLAPTHDELDVTRPETVEGFFSSHDIDAVIHCAALARMGECERDPLKALKTNALGTYNLVVATLKKEKEANDIRFLHISTDGVYEGKKGKYKETDETAPYNAYGWTKLAAECAVRGMRNHCIIRTSFFDPENIRFDESATDMFSSKIPLHSLVKAIFLLMNHRFVGTINVGGERASEYERYKAFKPSLRSCTFEEVQRGTAFRLAKDASLECELWEKIKKDVDK